MVLYYESSSLIIKEVVRAINSDRACSPRAKRAVGNLGNLREAIWYSRLVAKGGWEISLSQSGSIKSLSRFFVCLVRN